jgi:hypothetical protein
MKERTIEFLSALSQTELFSRVGQPAERDGVSVVGSWQAAFEADRSEAWKDVKLDARNELTAKLHEYWMPRFRDWNRLVGEIKAVLLPIIYPACEPLSQRHGLGLKLRNAADWDLVAACMEYEYADLVAPKFYDHLAKFYLAGRFPCGWQGEYPQGQLEIY